MAAGAPGASGALASGDCFDDGGDDDEECSCSDASASLSRDDSDWRHLTDGTFSLDVFSPEFSQSPVYKAIVRCSLPALYHAIYCLGESATHTDANFGVGFLHLAVSTATRETQAALEPFVHALANFRADPSLKDHADESPLRLALRRGLPDLARALLRCGAHQEPAADAAAIAEAAAADSDAPERELRATCAQFAPGLWAAAESGDYFLVDRLLASWCRVRICRPDGETLIQFARRVGSGSLVVELLEGSRATLEFVHATLAGDARKMAGLLANRNVNADVRDRGYRPGPGAPCRPRSLRETAVAMGHPPRVLRLLPDRSTAAAAARAGPSGGNCSGAVTTRPSSAVCAVM